MRMTTTIDRVRALPIWNGAPDILALPGGLSNEAYLVTDRSGKHVARLGRDFPFHHVFRDREVMSARAAHAAGFAYPVEHAEPGLMVVRYIEGNVLDADGVRRNIPRIADLLRRFHAELPHWVSGPGFIFWVSHVNRDYALTLAGSANPLTARLPELMRVNDRLEAAQTALPIVFGHHDLLPANLIDDGDRLWLIDYEYAGFGTPMFDLANLVSNAQCTETEAESLLAAYFDDRVTDELRRSHAAMQCASLLREALWSLVSEMFLTVPGANYDAYARENFDRFDAALAHYSQTYEKA